MWYDKRSAREPIEESDDTLSYHAEDEFFERDREVTLPIRPRRAVIEHELRRLQAELAEFDRLPSTDAELPNGTALRIEVQLSSQELIFTYLALRVNDRWYTTGHPRLYRSWTHLLEWLASPSITVISITRLENGEVIV